MEQTEIVVNERILRASSKTEVVKLSNAITAYYEKDPKTTIIVRAIGAGAVNQAVKAIIASGQYFSQKRLCVVTKSGFRCLEEDGRKTTAIEFKLEFQNT